MTNSMGVTSSSASAKLPSAHKLGSGSKTNPATQPLKKIEESSDRYEDEDFGQPKEQKTVTKVSEPQQQFSMKEHSMKRMMED